MSEPEAKQAKVFVLPGIERRDMCGPVLEPREVLQKAIDNGITDVLVVGRDRKGEQYVSGSMNDIDKATGLLFAAATMLAGMAFKR